MIELILKATLLLAIIFAVNAAMRRASAATRQLLWTLAFVGILALPLANYALRPVHWTPQPVVRMMAQAIPPGTSQEDNIAIPDAKPKHAPYGAIYLTGLLLLSIRLLVGTARLAWLTAHASPFTGDSQLPDHIDIRVSNLLALPITWGFLRPVILLPAASQDWPLDRLRLVLAHEFAHIRRWDYLGQIAAHLACALYWFHPLVWWAKKQLIKERESACDDEVLNMGSSGIEYAEHLLAIVRAAAKATAPLSSIAMAQSNLEQRLRMILAPRANRRAPATRTVCAATVLALCIFTPLAAIHGQSSNAGALSGVVRDPSGAVIPHAMITATNVDAGNIEAAYADAAGNYELKSLPAGHYTIEVKTRGFEIFRQTNFLIAAGNSAQFDPTMRVGSINETIEVVGQRPPSTATAPRAVPQRIRVGGNIQASKLLTRINPSYPANAQRNGIEGTVLLRAVIGADGHLLSLAAAGSSADPELTAAALDAVRLWTYEPTLLNGKPVEVVTTVAVNFRLE